MQDRSQWSQSDPIDPPAEEVASRRRQTWLSPMSGGAILFLDNIFFGANISTGMLATPLVCTLAFFTTGTAVFFIQKMRAGDSWMSSGIKALLSAMVAAIPSSIAGTAFGSLVLFASGMHALSHGVRLSSKRPRRRDRKEPTM